jgi:hypothetical protein
MDHRKGFALEELIKIEGSSLLLKTMVRAVYLFNTKGMPESWRAP